MQLEDTIYRDRETGKCWIKTSEIDGIIILRRGRVSAAFDAGEFAERFEEVA